MITFDQWLDIIVRISEPETGFDIQQKVHESHACITEWQDDNLTNSQIIEALNFDGSDPELATVKTHLNSLTKAQTLALERVMLLGAEGLTVTGKTYDKALLRTEFGL